MVGAGQAGAGEEEEQTDQMTPQIPDKLSELRRAIDLLFEPGDVIEVRIPKAGKEGTISGYFNDPDLMARSVLSMDGKGPGVYWTLNPVNPALLARASNRVRTRAESTTADRDILVRRWLPIDLDAERPSGISSSDPEHSAAIERARQIRAALRAEGWPEPIFADSGNGAHLLYRLPDLPNTQESTELVSRCLKGLAARFGDSAVKVDETTFNASRIFKAYGTTARKGDNTPDRPHRVAHLLEIPKEIPE